MKEMNEKKYNEKELDQYIENIKKDDIIIPDELEQRIRSRIANLKHQTPVKRNIIAASLAFCLLFACSIRFSPLIASYAAEIPGLATVVEWLRGDSGIRNAQEHGYGGISPIIVEQDGFILKIADIFFDEDRLRFSAVVTGPEMVGMLPVKQDVSKPVQYNEAAPFRDNSNDVHLQFHFKDFNNSGYGMTSQGQNDEFLAFNVEKSFDPGDAAAFIEKGFNVINLDLTIRKGNKAVYTFHNLQLPFNASRFNFSNVYTQDKNIALQHTAIMIDSFTISPTRMKLKVRFKMEDGYFFTDFENPYLKDEKGNIYKGEGIIARHSSPSERILYFVPSTYFDKQPKKLYFCFDGIRIGSEEGNRFTLSLDETYPKNLMYMGKQITITQAAWHATGKLTVKFEYPDDSTLKIQGLNIVDNESVKTSGWGSSSKQPDTQSGNAISENFCDFEIEKRAFYNMEFQYPGYLIPSGMDVELALKK